MIEPFKYLIQAVALERDETGRFRELPAQPLTVYNAEEARKAIEEFEQNLRGEQSNGSRAVDRADDHLRQPGLPGNVGVGPG